MKRIKSWLFNILLILTAPIAMLFTLVSPVKAQAMPENTFYVHPNPEGESGNFIYRITINTSYTDLYYTSPMDPANYAYINYVVSGNNLSAYADTVTGDYCIGTGLPLCGNNPIQNHIYTHVYNFTSPFEINYFCFDTYINCSPENLVLSSSEDLNDSVLTQTLTPPPTPPSTGLFTLENVAQIASTIGTGIYDNALPVIGVTGGVLGIGWVLRKFRGQ